MDERVRASLPEERSASGTAPDGPGCGKELVAGTGSRVKVLPGHSASGVRREGGWVPIFAPGRERKLLRGPGVAIGPASDGSAPRCKFPEGYAGGARLRAEVRHGAVKQCGLTGL